jgi:molybdopterin molybdotransferase
MTEYDEMLWRTEAVDRVLSVRAAALSDQPTETVGLDAVAGRTTAESITANQDVPDSDYATMDGYAVDATEGYPLTVVSGETFPEDEGAELEPGEATRIATGAPLPERANAVVKREEATVEDGELTGPELTPGTYVYERGSNVARGEELFAAGESLSPKDSILLGDLGHETVRVRERFSTAVLATGTEIHEGESQDLDSDMLAGLVRAWGHEATYEGSVPDEYDRVRDRLADLAAEYDVVLTTGGTSVGKKDYVVRALADLGEVRFHQVRVRPGKPIAVARSDEAVFFAIPGKPVGAHTIASAVARPFFTGSGSLPTEPATVSADVGLGPEGFEYAIPVVREGEEAVPLGHASSALSVYEETFDPSVLSSSTRATRADGLVFTRSALSAGETVSVVPYPVLE